jgi:hypothetical protein
MDGDRFQRAIAAIDAANAEDPTILSVGGVDRPKELAHAQMVTEWILRMHSNPSDALLLAARAHHIRRWVSPRGSFPDGRAGYLRWRRDLSRRQVEEVGRILADVGYDDVTIGRVRAIVAKANLAGDAEVQALEDAICLVFLETQFDDLAARLDHDRMVEVVRKTMAKMSPAAMEQVATIRLSEQGRGLVAAASST